MTVGENELPSFVPCGWVIPSRRIVIIPKTKTVLRNVGKQLPPKHSATNQKSWYLNVKTSLRTIKYFSAVRSAACSAPVVQHDLAAPSQFSLHSSVSLITQTTRSVAVTIAALVRFERTDDN